MSYDVVNTDTVHTATGMETVCTGHSTRTASTCFSNAKKRYIF